MVKQANHNIYRMPDGTWQMALSVQDLAADGRLYVVYNTHLPGPLNGVDGLVAQKMIGPSQPASVPPVTLLKPTGLESERPSPDPNDPVELVETGNVLKIGSVWVLIYSTGSVNHTNYKIGVAYADSPVPQGGYCTVLIPDPRHVWGTTGDEVDYLLQT